MESQKILIVVVLRQRIFLVPLISEKFGRGVKSGTVHSVVQKAVDFFLVLFVETHGVCVVDKFSYNTGLTAVIKYIGKDTFLIGIVAPFVDNVVANPLNKRTA